MAARSELLGALDETVYQLVAVVNDCGNADQLVYEDWSVKDIVGHLAFWHESFAHNVYALSHGFTPQPLKGKLSDLNRQGVCEKRQYLLKEVLQQLTDAQQTIRECIPALHQTLIPYRKGSRDYSPEEHLEIVTAHIRSHLKDIFHALMAGD